MMGDEWPNAPEDRHLDNVTIIYRLAVAKFAEAPDPWRLRALERAARALLAAELLRRRALEMKP